MELFYIRQILSGDLSKFTFLVEKYKDMAYSIAIRMVNHQEDAEDVVQDSFIKAYQSLGTFRQEAKFSTWFYKIVVNTALTKVKRKRNFTTSETHEEISEIAIGNIESAYQKLAQTDQQNYVNRALDMLNQEDSLLLTLYYLNENSLEEIQEITGIIKENIKMKLYRARKKMYIVLSKLLHSEMKNIL